MPLVLYATCLMPPVLCATCLVPPVLCATCLVPPAVCHLPCARAVERIAAQGGGGLLQGPCPLHGPLSCPCPQLASHAHALSGFTCPALSALASQVGVTRVALQVSASSNMPNSPVQLTLSLTLATMAPATAEVLDPPPLFRHVAMCHVSPCVMLRHVSRFAMRRHVAMCRHSVRVSDREGGRKKRRHLSLTVGLGPG